MTERLSSFIKKLLQKQNVYRNKKLSIAYCLFSDIIIQTNKLFVLRDLLNFTAKFIGGQIKAFSFIFCTISD